MDSIYKNLRKWTQRSCQIIVWSYSDRKLMIWMLKVFMEGLHLWRFAFLKGHRVILWIFFLEIYLSVYVTKVPSSIFFVPIYNKALREEGHITFPLFLFTVPLADFLLNLLSVLLYYAKSLEKTDKNDEERCSCFFSLFFNPSFPSFSSKQQRHHE